MPGAAAVGGDGQTLALAATDTGVVWRIALEPAKLSWCHAQSTAGGDLVVGAPVADLYLFVWGRIQAPDVTGDAALLARCTAATAL